jgi:peroxiredoxin
MPTRKTLLAFGVLLLTPMARAQDAPAGADAKKDVAAGHSHHGEVFNEGPRQKAYLLGGTGNVHLAVTTKLPKAQAFFDQGVGQLHGFWYFEAERSFRQVAALDPDCAMAYWGMAMANLDNAKRAKGFIAEAVKREKAASPREQKWIDGLAEYLSGKVKDRKQSRRNYIASLEALVKEYPNELEAKAFLSVRLWQYQRDLPKNSRARADQLHDQIFGENPMHPAHHYRIHLWDYPNPRRALGSAARCGQSAPTIAHMWHMPGHIYSRLKRYPDAVWQQEASSRADHTHMIRYQVMPDEIFNYAHNQEWLIRNLINIGRVRDALAMSKNLIELPRHPRYNTLQKRGRSAAYGRARLMLVLERFDLWDETLALAPTMYLEPTSIPAEQVKRLRLVGLAYAGKGDRKKLQETIAKLKRRLGPEAGAAGEKAAPRKVPARDRATAAAVAELEAYDALLAGDARGALARALKVRGMNRGVLARFYLAAGEKDKAVALVAQAVASGKNEVEPLARQVAILHAAGKMAEAKSAFAELQKISAHIDDLDVPLFRALAPVAKAAGQPEDWRAEVVPSPDVGERPPLDDIGPLRWHPPKAPAWALHDAEGKTVHLSDYRGKPVLVIFYLGHGCIHCVEQLNAFAPKTEAFRKVGIELLAISTDPAEDLPKSQRKYRPVAGRPAGEERFPFPLVSDAKLEVFREYRAFDDFENVPLHGTFLIDGRGRVRWQDISYEPFTDTAFVLAEAQRLLALPQP